MEERNREITCMYDEYVILALEVLLTAYLVLHTGLLKHIEYICEKIIEEQ
jgi:hypothetical protein